MKLLEEQRIKVKVLDMYCLKPLDKDAILDAAMNSKLILTIEEHAPFGGLGAMVAQTVAEKYQKKVISLALPDGHVVTGSSKEAFDYYGLNAMGIVRTVLEHLE